MADFNSIINSDKPTLVDFYATWCGPCRMQSPIIDKVKAAVGDTANIIKIDVDANPEVSARYEIRSIPTLILFQAGEAIWRAYGVQQENVLIDKINEHVGKVKL